MKLTRVTVKNFRSYVIKANEREACLDLGDGLNLLVGRNNCGKSNLLKSVALALEDLGGTKFDPSTDLPQQLSWAFPVITLSFKADASKSVEKTLLRYLVDYERSAGSRRTMADAGELQYRVKYTTARRDAVFVARGAGNRRGDPVKLKKCLDQFQKCVRFIYLRSGENLQEFLSGTFHELLHTVLRENLKKELQRAEQSRERYIEGLRSDLLKPLGSHTLKQLRDVMSEIQEINVMPFSPAISEALSNAVVRIKDDADTDILSKGTGVRGTLLVALLSYIAEHSRRSLILAVEEPESFLHPAGQQELRADLARLAKRAGVTLVVTTHSPFLLNRSESTSIVPFKKDLEGISRIGKPVRGSESHVPIVSSLFGETITPTVLERVEPLKAKAEAVLFVEGYTDREYLLLAAKLCGRKRLLERLEIRYGGGADKAALQALLFRQLVGDTVPAIVLLDYDNPGKKARDMLRKFNWHKDAIMTYRDWLDDNDGSTPVEVEDMFSDTLKESFIAMFGDDVIAETMRFSGGGFHYGFTAVGKDQFLDYVRGKATVRDFAMLEVILNTLQEVFGIHD